jgi:hypothetical protein
LTLALLQSVASQLAYEIVNTSTPIQKLTFIYKASHIIRETDFAGYPASSKAGCWISGQKSGAGQIQVFQLNIQITGKIGNEQRHQMYGTVLKGFFSRT